MSWAAFWIDTTNIGAQIGVATSSMLTLIAYRFMIGTLLPRVSYLTRLDIFILGSTVLVFLTLLEVIVISVLVRAEHLAAARRMDLWSRSAFPLGFIIILLAAIFF